MLRLGLGQTRNRVRVARGLLEARIHASMEDVCVHDTSDVVVFECEMDNIALFG